MGLDHKGSNNKCFRTSVSLYNVWIAKITFETNTVSDMEDSSKTFDIMSLMV